MYFCLSLKSSCKQACHLLYIKYIICTYTYLCTSIKCFTDFVGIGKRMFQQNKPDIPNFHLQWSVRSHIAVYLFLP